LKGCRRVEFDRRAKTAWLCCTRVFAWHSPGAIAWRKRVGELAVALGVADMEGIRHKLGPKWAYRLREAITLAVEDDWQSLLRSLCMVQKELRPVICRDDYRENWNIDCSIKGTGHKDTLA
jgi:hypothetical protein